MFTFVYEEILTDQPMVGTS